MMPAATSFIELILLVLRDETLRGTRSSAPRSRPKTVLAVSEELPAAGVASIEDGDGEDERPMLAVLLRRSHLASASSRVLRHPLAAVQGRETAETF